MDTYVGAIPGYNLIEREAQIFSWDEDVDDDGYVSWHLGWYHELESNERNINLTQTLKRETLYRSEYKIGRLQISPKKIHFVDEYIDINPTNFQLTDTGKKLKLTLRNEYLYKSIEGNSSVEQLGDERISYTGIPEFSPATYFGSIKSLLAIGKQFDYSNSTVSGFIRDDGILHHIANNSREVALETMKHHISNLKWIVRGIGTLVIIFGIWILIDNFLYIFIQIPIIGSLVETGALIAGIILGSIVSLITITTSLIFHNIFLLITSIIIIIESVLLITSIIIIIGSVLLINRQSKKTSKNAKSQLKHYHTPQINTKPINRVEMTFINLIKLALADKRLTKKESKFLTTWGLKNGIGKERMSELFKETKNNPDKSLHKTTVDDLHYLICLALADGYFSGSELFYINSFGKMLGLSYLEVKKMIAILTK